MGSLGEKYVPDGVFEAVQRRTKLETDLNDFSTFLLVLNHYKHVSQDFPKRL
jgi:hypothetical protein